MHDIIWISRGSALTKKFLNFLAWAAETWCLSELFVLFQIGFDDLLACLWLADFSKAILDLFSDLFGDCVHLLRGKFKEFLV